MDRLVSTVRTHIDTVRNKRDELAKASVPPARLFDHAFNQADRQMMDVGATLNRVYKNTLNKAIRKQGQLTPADYEAARIATEGYLAQFPDDQHSAILRGALVSTYLSDNPTDSALWMRGAKTENGYAPGMANKTLKALREIGVLDELGEVSGRVVRYPGAVVSEPDFQHSIGLSGVWFNWYRAWQTAHGQSPVETMSEMPRAQAEWAKQQVELLSQQVYQDLPLTVRREGDRLKAYTEDGNLFGFVSRDSEKMTAEGTIQLGFTIAKDGNVRAVWRPERL